MRITLSLLAFLLIGGSFMTPKAAAETTQTMSIRDFGARGDDQADDRGPLQAAVNQAIANGIAELRIPPGTYRLQGAADGQAALLIEGATSLTLRGEPGQTHLVITNPRASGIWVKRSTAINIVGLSVDYDPLPFTQGTIAAIDIPAGSIDLQLDPGYPSPAAPHFAAADPNFGQWGLPIDRATRRIPPSMPDATLAERWEPLDGTTATARLWRLHMRDSSRGHVAQLVVGGGYVQLARMHASAIFLLESDAVMLEDVSVHASPSLALGFVRNGQVTIRRFCVAFPADQPGRAPRLITTNADGAHGQANRVGPLIEDCLFEGMADDAINLYYHPVVITEIASPTRVQFAGYQEFDPGDPVWITDPRTGRLLSRNTVASREELPGNVTWLNLVDPVEGLTAGHDKLTGDAIYNMKYAGPGAIVRNNVMRNHRRYGVFLKTPGARIEHNTFENLPASAIYAANDPHWPEGPFPDRPIIRDNVMRGCNYGMWYVDHPRMGVLTVMTARIDGPAEQRLVTGAVIENNIIEGTPGLPIYLGGIQDLQVRGNRISIDETIKRAASGPLLRLDSVGGAVLSGNAYTDLRSSTTAAVEVMPSVDAGEAGLRIEAESAQLAPGRPAVLDVRRSTP